jgi:hypothetical protein
MDAGRWPGRATVDQQGTKPGQAQRMKDGAGPSDQQRADSGAVLIQHCECGGAQESGVGEIDDEPVVAGRRAGQGVSKVGEGAGVDLPGY